MIVLFWLATMLASYKVTDDLGCFQRQSSIRRDIAGFFVILLVIVVLSLAMTAVAAEPITAPTQTLRWVW
jgi:hypothetical protein